MRRPGPGECQRPAQGGGREDPVAEIEDRVFADRLDGKDAPGLDRDRRAAGRPVRGGASDGELPRGRQGRAAVAQRSDLQRSGLLESQAAPMAETTTKLDVQSRAADGSRAARRLRRAGRVPGVLYGGGG